MKTIEQLQQEFDAKVVVMNKARALIPLLPWEWQGANIWIRPGIYSTAGSISMKVKSEGEAWALMAAINDLLLPRERLTSGWVAFPPAGYEPKETVTERSPCGPVTARSSKGKEYESFELEGYALIDGERYIVDVRLEFRCSPRSHCLDLRLTGNRYGHISRLSDELVWREPEGDVKVQRFWAPEESARSATFYVEV